MTLFGADAESRHILNAPPSGSVPAINSLTEHPSSGKAPLVTDNPEGRQLKRGTLPTFLPHDFEKPELHVSEDETAGPTQFPGTKESSWITVGSCQMFDANVTYHMRPPT